MTTKVTKNLVKTPFRKNFVINGNMQFWQRGTEKALIEYEVPILADRFMFYNQRGTGGATYRQSTDTPSFEESGSNFKYSMEVDITATRTPSGTDEGVILTAIEGTDFQLIYGQKATLSFWVKSNKLGDYSVAFRNADANKTYTMKYTIDVADTWEKKVFTCDFDIDGTWNFGNGRGVGITWCLMNADSYATTSLLEQWNSANTPYILNQANLFSNVGNYFRLTGVQLESGIESTLFEESSLAEQKILCQRYCERGWVRYINYSAGAGAYGGIWVGFSTRKRANPSILLLTPTENINCGGQATNYSRENGFRIHCNTVAAGNYYYSGEFIASADII